MTWFIHIWNKYDEGRVRDVGPDRAAAEWLLRCGAGVTWKGATKPLKDYNALPVGDYRRYKIQKIDATESAVMETGFRYLADLTELTDLKLKNCKYLTDDSLRYLTSALMEKRVSSLEVSDTGMVSDEGVAIMRKLDTLKRLRLENLAGVRDPQEVMRKFAEDLPGCKVIWPPHTEDPEVWPGGEQKGGG